MVFINGFSGIAIGENVIFFSEDQVVTFTSELLKAVLPLVEQSSSEDEIVDTLGDKFDYSSIYYGLNILKKKGIIADDIEKAKIKIPRLLLTSIGISQSIFDDIAGFAGQATGADAVFDCNKALERLSKDQLLIVFVDSYQNDELEIINKKLLDRKASWLPCKPCGDTLWVGPLFGDEQKYCFHCLSFRLNMKRPYRKIWNSTHKNTIIDSTESNLLLSAGLLVQELNNYYSHHSDAALNDGMMTYDFSAGTSEKHKLTRRPQCSVCGNPELEARQFENIPHFQSRIKCRNTDGGDRIKPAAESLKYFLPRVSRITGDVSSLEAVIDEKQGFGYSIYWSKWNSPDSEKLLTETNWRKGRTRAAGISCGKGRSAEQSQMSAIGEALERYSTCFFGYEPYITASENELADDCIGLSKLASFSKSQYEHAEEWSKKGVFAFIPKPYDKEIKIAWTKVFSLTNQAWKWIPTAYLFYKTPLLADKGTAYCSGDSNGVAGGNCIEEAFMQGFYELIERDAVAAWWYNMVKRPGIDIASFNNPKFDSYVKTFNQKGLKVAALNLTNDFGITVIAVLAYHENGDAPVLGLGAHFNPYIALDRALSEAVQGMVNGGPNPSEDKYDWWKELNEPGNADFLYPDENKRLNTPSDFNDFASDDFLKDINTAVRLMKEHDLETFAFDLSRPETGLSVVRVIVPGLCHFWPRFANRHMYEVPVKLGWIPKCLREDELNQVPFQW